MYAPARKLRRSSATMKTDYPQRTHGPQQPRQVQTHACSPMAHSTAHTSAQNVLKSPHSSPASCSESNEAEGRLRPQSRSASKYNATLHANTRTHTYIIYIYIGFPRYFMQLATASFTRRPRESNKRDLQLTDGMRPGSYAGVGRMRVEQKSGVACSEVYVRLRDTRAQLTHRCLRKFPPYELG